VVAVQQRELQGKEVTVRKIILKSLQSEDRPIAVLPGGARHLGWRKGDSTWQQIETPEFEEYKR
jgi:hypothetical protein